MRTKMSLLVAAIAAVLLSGGAQALSVGDVRQRVVNYSDLNLSNEAGAAVLYQRITHAAHIVCQLPMPWDGVIAARVRTCIQSAKARSVSEVNAPALTRYFESRQKKPTAVAMSARES